MPDESYVTTASKQKKEKLRPPKEWIVPANPKYYDIEHAFDDTDEIDWKQGTRIKVGKGHPTEEEAQGTVEFYKELD